MMHRADPVHCREATRCLRRWIQAEPPALKGFVAGTLAVAPLYRDRALAVFESLGGTGRSAPGPVVAGYDNCEFGLCR